MTAVIAPTTYRNGWSTGSQISMNNMSSEGEGSRIFLPRKSAQRSNSSSSLASSTASSSTTSSPATQPNGIAIGVASGDDSYITANATRKKPARGIWGASSKAESVSGVSSARSQPVAGNNVGQTATSAMSALHNAGPQPSQPSSQPQSQINGVGRGHSASEPTMLQLQPLNGTFERKTIIVPIAPDILRIGRQTNQKTLPTPSNGYFDSKVLSRQHAEIWSDRDSKVWIRDVKSSNGTFVNGKRLSQENRDSEPHPLNYSDILELGIDIVSEDQKTIVHHKVAARVDHAGPHAPVNNGSESEMDFLPGSRMISKGQYSQHNTGPNGQNGRIVPAGLANHNHAAPAQYHPKWLQPVSMEQIVKRLNVELKQARRQSSSLSSNAGVIGTRSVEQKANALPPVDKAPLLPTKSVENIKARFSSTPPAPPPSQPLPEAPPDAVIRSRAADFSSLPPLLRRTDTERPKHIITSMSANSSPIKPENTSQILSLVEQLSTAQKEIAVQGQRLKDMETALSTEREARRHAEEEAMEFRNASAVLANGVRANENTSGDMDVGLDLDQSSKQLGSDLQQRFDLMKIEMDEMKMQMEHYRLRTKHAEQESKRDHQTLADMVESIRKRDEAAARRKEQRTRSRDVTSPASELEEADEEVQALEAKLDGEIQHAEKMLEEVSRNTNGTAITNGSAKGPMSISELQQLGKAAIAAAMANGNQAHIKSHEHSADATEGQRALAHTHRSSRQEQLVQSAPYASLIGVVLLGVGMMAYLNGWQRVAER